MTAVVELVTIDENLIEQSLADARGHQSQQIQEILLKAKELKGLESEGSGGGADGGERSGACWTSCSPRRARCKEEIYGNRLVLFAPLYISNLCRNECLYCAFRAAQHASSSAGR